MRKVIVDEWMSLDGVVPSLKLSAGLKQSDDGITKLALLEPPLPARDGAAQELGRTGELIWTGQRGDAAESIPNALRRTLPEDFHDVDPATLAAEPTFLGT